MLQLTIDVFGYSRDLFGWIENGMNERKRKEIGWKEVDFFCLDVEGRLRGKNE